MELLPTLLTLLVAAALAAACLTLRKRGNRFPWLNGREKRHLELLDRLPLTHQHSLHLVALKGRWLAIAVTPQGCQLLESGDDKESQASGAPDFPDRAAQDRAARAGGRL